MFLFFFFFSSRRRHTRFSRDWSSDVCSSDLRSNETSAETLRNCVLRVRCTVSCTSPSVRPETRTGPASGRATRPSRSTVRSSRCETPPRGRSKDCRPDQPRSSARREGPSEYNLDLPRLCGTHRGRTFREADWSSQLARKGHTRKAHPRTDSGDAPSSLALLLRHLQWQNCALPGTVRSSGLTGVFRRPSTIGSTVASRVTGDLAEWPAEPRDCPHSRTQVYVVRCSVVDSCRRAPK